jgi:hypothetical protein
MGEEDRAVETASIQTKPEIRGVEDRRGLNNVIFFLQSAEADIVCVDAVSTAV